MDPAPPAGAVGGAVGISRMDATMPSNTAAAELMAPQVLIGPTQGHASAGRVWTSTAARDSSDPARALFLISRCVGSGLRDHQTVAVGILEPEFTSGQILGVADLAGRQARNE